MMINVSACSLSAMAPSSAAFDRWVPSKVEGAGDHTNGKAHRSLFAIWAITGAAPVPGTAAEACGHKDHVAPLEHFIQFFC